MIDIGLEFEVGETEDDLEFDAQDYVGLSAYQIAVKHGYEGTEEQWIASINKTKTSQLENDGNGKSPFATEAYVDEHSSTGGTTDYNQLINKPKINGVELSGEVELTVPHSTSELNNDGDGNSPFATKTEVEEAIAAIPAPKVPTKTSELENDGDGTSSFATQQDVADAAKDKLTTVTSTDTDRAYVAKSDGTQGTIDVATGVAANTLAQRDADGRLQVGAATADNDAVNLAYANAHYAAAEKVQNKLDKNKGGWSVYEPYRKAYIVTRGGGQDTLYISEYSRPNGYNSNWIVGYSSAGNLLCTSTNWEREPGQSSNFATNKGYVDAADNKIKDTVSKQAADINLLYTLLENTIITNTTVEDTYTSRVTASGLPVVSNTPTTVHKIAGDTVATEGGLKHASFKGVTSTGRNLITSLKNSGFTQGGITFAFNADNGTVTMNGITNVGVSEKVTEGFYLSKGTYTLYVPNRILYTAWSIKTASNKYIDGIFFASPADVKTETFTITEPGYHTVQVEITPNAGTVTNYVETPMVLFGTITENFPDFETYHADTSFQLSAAPQLRKWDYIDVDNQRLVTGTAEVTQETEFTDDELATYPAGYILSADRKTIAYPLETPTTAPLIMPKSYTAWRNGSETVDTGATDALPPTITQNYYEEVSKA